MPALGLLLEEPLFESYNKRMATINEKLKPTDPNYRPLIDFSQYQDKMEAFKEQFIYKNMREVEDRDGLYVAFFSHLLQAILIAFNADSMDGFNLSMPTQATIYFI